MVICIRMKDGKELSIECENMEVGTHRETGQLTKYKMEDISGDTIPIYMPVDEIALIWRDVKAEKEREAVNEHED